MIGYDDMIIFPFPPPISLRAGGKSSCLIRDQTLFGRQFDAVYPGLPALLGLVVALAIEVFADGDLAGAKAVFVADLVGVPGGEALIEILELDALVGVVVDPGAGLAEKAAEVIFTAAVGFGVGDDAVGRREAVLLVLEAGADEVGEDTGSLFAQQARELAVFLPVAVGVLRVFLPFGGDVGDVAQPVGDDADPALQGEVGEEPEGQVVGDADHLVRGIKVGLFAIEGRAADEGVASGEALEVGGSDAAVLFGLAGDDEAPAVEADNVGAGSGCGARVFLLEDELWRDAPGELIENVVHGFDEGSFAVGAVADKKEDDLLGGEAGEAIAEIAPDEVDLCLVAFVDLVQEGVPVGRLGVGIVGDLDSAHEQVVWVAGVELAGLQVDDAVGAGELQRLFVEFVAVDGEATGDVVRPPKTFFCASFGAELIGALVEFGAIGFEAVNLLDQARFFQGRRMLGGGIVAAVGFVGLGAGFFEIGFELGQLFADRIGGDGVLEGDIFDAFDGRAHDIGRPVVPRPVIPAVLDLIKQVAALVHGAEHQAVAALIVLDAAMDKARVIGTAALFLWLIGAPGQVLGFRLDALGDLRGDINDLVGHQRALSVKH